MITLPTNARIISADQRPLDWGILAAMALRKHTTIEYMAHDLDGQSPNAIEQGGKSPIWKGEDSVWVQHNGRLVLSRLRRSHFSLLSMAFPFGISPAIKMPQISEAAGLAIKTTTEHTRGIFSGRVDIFERQTQGLLKGGLTLGQYPELRGIMWKLFMGRFGPADRSQPGYFHLIENIAKTSNSEQRQGILSRNNSLKLRFMLWLLTNGSTYELWKSFGSKIFHTPKHKMWGSTVDMMCEEGTKVLNWWFRNPDLRKAYTERFGNEAFFAIRVDPNTKQLVRTKIRPEHLTKEASKKLSALYPGLIGVSPVGYLLLIWLRQNYVVLSGSIGYEEKVLEVCRLAGIKFKAQIIAEINVANQFAKLDLNTDLLKLWHLMGANVDKMPIKLRSALVDAVTKTTIAEQKPDVVTLYLLGGDQLIQRLLTKASFKTVQ